MVRPMIPIIEYYANYNYIVTELCENKDKPFLECNGKCYLAKELKKVNYENHNHKSNLPKINFKDFLITSIENDNYSFLYIESLPLKIFGNKEITPFKLYNSILKPPKIA
jgi:hypothetical protein